MGLSLESCKYRLCQIDKPIKIFENVAFSGSHFLKVYIYCKLETVSILDIVSTCYSLCHSFYQFVKHRPENKELNVSLQNEIDVLEYFTLIC